MRKLAGIILGSALWFGASLAAGGNNTWTSGGPAGYPIRSVVAHPDVPSIVYASSGAGGVFKSTDGGQTWNSSDTGIPGQRAISAVAIDPSTPSTLYAASPSGQLEGGVYQSINSGATWTKLGAGIEIARPWLMVVDPVTSTNVYVGTLYGGVFKRTATSDWFPVNSGLGGTAVTALIIDPQNHSTLYASTQEAGLHRSTDGGTNWISINSGLDTLHSAYALAVDPTNSAVIYASKPGSGLFRSSDGGTSWSRVVSMLPDVWCLAIDPTHQGTVYAGASPSGVYRTTDHGATWSPFDTGLPPSAHNVSALVIDPTGTQLHAGTEVGEWDYLIAPGLPGPCSPSTTTLCLDGSRFQVEVSWSTPTQGQSGVARSIPMTPDTGYFWFFNSANVELVVKVLDGRPVNGFWWVFYGALSNVEYTITVTDTTNGAIRTYTNPNGQLASFADTTAF